MALGSAQPLTEMSTKDLSIGKGLPACTVDNLTAFCVENRGASTSHISMGLHGILQG
jgi:hypothetical protein